MLLESRKCCSIVTVFCCGILLNATLFSAAATSAEARKSTYTYKKVDDLEIKLDVYRDESIEQPQPVLVWIHGGALIVGNRDGIDRRIKQGFAGNGSILVSIDYRLAPETHLAEIIADVEDAFRFVREKGPELFHADPDRIAVAGASAGGYLTLTAAYRVKPHPVAALSLFGYGNLFGEWYNEPSSAARFNSEKISREEAYQQVLGKPIADHRDRKGNGMKFFVYTRQRGMWTEGVSGWNPKKDADKLIPYSPNKNVTPDYPPTFLIHGDKDTDVPYYESVQMADEMKKQGVEHKLVILAGGEHGFGGADPKAIDETYVDGIKFLHDHLQKK